MRKFNITVNGVPYEVEVEEVSSDAPAAQAAPAAARPAAPAAAKPAVKPAAAPIAAGEQVKAPMPGTIADVKVQPGAKVKTGDVLMILEAMKMENEVVSPKDGTVAQIPVAKGASVNTGDVLCVLN